MYPQPDEVINVSNALNTYLQWKSINGHPRSYLHYHPSEWGMCLRKAQYARYADMGIIKTPEKEPHKPELCRIFDTGHAIHNRWANYFEDMGVLRGCWKCKNINCNKVFGKENKIGEFRPESCECGSTVFEYQEVTVSWPEINFKGNADQILDFSRFDVAMFEKGNPVKCLFDPSRLPKSPIVNDMKSINSNGFDPKGFVKTSLPKAEHRIQLQIYINCMDLEYGMLMYENKDTSEVKTFQVERDEKIWNKIVEQAKMMNSMIENKLLPPPKHEKKDCYQCKSCQFKPICHGSKIWNDPNLEEKRQKFYNMTIS